MTGTVRQLRQRLQPSQSVLLATVLAARPQISVMVEASTNSAERGFYYRAIVASVVVDDGPVQRIGCSHSRAGSASAENLYAFLKRRIGRNVAKGAGCH
jgi:hypothetical protein